MWYQQEEYPANAPLIDYQFFSKPTIYSQRTNFLIYQFFTICVKMQ